MRHSGHSLRALRAKPWDLTTAAATIVMEKAKIQPVSNVAGSFARALGASTTRLSNSSSGADSIIGSLAMLSDGSYHGGFLDSAAFERLRHQLSDFLATQGDETAILFPVKLGTKNIGREFVDQIHPQPEKFTYCQ